jgi:hypothetical protein
VDLDDRGRPAEPADARAFEISVDTGRRVHLVAEHLRVAIGAAEALVWLSEWGVWPSGERPHLFTRLRASYGETRPLIEAPAQVFGRDEHDDLVSFVTLGVLFLWDVYVVLPRGIAVHYSHDEYGWLGVH